TVGEIVTSYVAYVSEQIEKEAKTEGTVHTYTEPRLAGWKDIANALARFTATYGLRTASTVSHKEIASFLAGIKSASMANRMYSMLRNCFAWACQVPEDRTEPHLEMKPVRLIESKRRKEHSDDENSQRWLRDHEVLPVWNALLDDGA